MTKGTRVFRGDRLKAARDKMELNQEGFLDIGIQQAQISRYENGTHEPSPELIVKIANKLNVTTDYLLGRTDDPDTSVKSEDLSKDERELIDLVSKIGLERARKLVDKSSAS